MLRVHCSVKKLCSPVSSLRLHRGVNRIQVAKYGVSCYLTPFFFWLLNNDIDIIFPSLLLFLSYAQSPELTERRK